MFREVFDRRVDLLQRYIQRDQLEETADLLQKISALSHYAGEQSSNAKNDKDLRSSEVKKLEIRLRKLIETLNDLRTTVPFEYAEGFDNTIRTLEQLRKTLLGQLLGEALVGNRTAGETGKRGSGILVASPGRTFTCGAPGAIAVERSFHGEGVRKTSAPSRIRKESGGFSGNC